MGGSEFWVYASISCESFVELLIEPVLRYGIWPNLKLRHFVWLSEGEIMGTSKRSPSILRMKKIGKVETFFLLMLIFCSSCTRSLE